MLKLKCPKCDRHLAGASQSLVGRKVKCRSCRHSFLAESTNGSPDTRAQAAGDQSTHSKRSPRRSSAPAVVPAEGQKVGQYVLQACLGRGSMGVVYKALHPRLGKTVAIKVLLEDDATGRAAARFEREMFAAGQVDHPHIVRALDAGETDGVPFLVTEYLEGEDLRTRVARRGALPVVEACRLIEQAARALQHAHERGIIHRDVKPSNLFMTADGQAKLLDLGLAKVPSTEAESGELTVSGQCLGTPDYMAPEQWTDARNVGPRADLYSLGCTLFFLLTGRPPYVVEGKSVTKSMIAHLQEAVPDLSCLRPDLPAPVAELVRALMSKTPADRPESAKHVAAELRRIPDAEKGLVPFELVTAGPLDREAPIAFESASLDRRRGANGNFWIAMTVTAALFGSLGLWCALSLL